MRGMIVANDNRSMTNVSRLLDRISDTANGRVAIIGRMLDDIDWTSTEIYNSCEDGNKARALRMCARLKKQIAKFESVTKLLEK